MPLTKITGGEFDNTQGGLSVAGIMTSGGARIGSTSPAAQYSTLSVIGDAAIIASGPTLSLVGTDGLTRYGYLYHGGAGSDLYLTNQQNGNLLFSTNNTERARLDSSGNFGLGTNSPGAKLDVRQDSSSTTIMAGVRVQNTNITTGSQSGIAFLNYDNYNAKIYSPRSGSSQGDIVFATNNGGGIAESNVVERARIDSAGRMTRPYQPAFFASGNQGTITVAVGSYFPFNTLNTTFANSNRNNGYSTSTYLYTAPVTGLYQFYIQIYLNTASNVTSMTWWKNGTQLDYGNDAAINIFMNTNSSTTPANIMMNGSVILELSANDTIGIKPRTGNPNGISLYTPHSTFWGYLIG